MLGLTKGYHHIVIIEIINIIVGQENLFRDELLVMSAQWLLNYPSNQIMFRNNEF